MSKPDAGRFLLFTLRDSTYAIDLQQVAEVIEPPPLFPIPLAPTHFIGAINSHGKIKPVLDLSLPAPDCSRPGRKIMVLEDRVADLAIMVDGVLSIASAETMEMKPADADNDLSDWIFSDGTEEIGLLALDRLLQRLEETVNG